MRVLDGSEASAPFVVLACHGDDGRIVLPELSPQVERYQPYHRSLGPEELASFVHLPGRTLFCTGCHTGTPELAEAFFRSGCAAYVAPTGASFGYAATVVVALVFYELVQQRTLDGAMARLAAFDDELAMWRLFRP